MQRPAYVATAAALIFPYSAGSPPARTDAVPPSTGQEVRLSHRPEYATKAVPIADTIGEVPGGGSWSWKRIVESLLGAHRSVDKGDRGGAWRADVERRPTFSRYADELPHRLPVVDRASRGVIGWGGERARLVEWSRQDGRTWHELPSGPERTRRAGIRWRRIEI